MKSKGMIIAEEVWNMLTDTAKSEMLPVKESFLESIEADVNHLLQHSDAVPNQCDGCVAGIPIDENGFHKMGNDKYPDYMICQKRKYESDAMHDETLNP